MLHSELLGHVKGAFTGAAFSRVGKFYVANGGTLFLDEVEFLPPAALDDATIASAAIDLPTMMPHRGIGVAPRRFSAPYRRSKPTAIA